LHRIVAPHHRESPIGVPIRWDNNQKKGVKLVQLDRSGEQLRLALGRGVIAPMPPNRIAMQTELGAKLAPPGARQLDPGKPRMAAYGATTRAIDADFGRTVGMLVHQLFSIKGARRFPVLPILSA
jgi:hypothetical protein